MKVLMMVAVAALIVAGCTPIRYAQWSSYRQQQANDDAYLSQRNAEAARWQSQVGDYHGAQLTRDAASEAAAKAQQERAHAARDRWLSQF